MMTQKMAKDLKQMQSILSAIIFFERMKTCAKMGIKDRMRPKEYGCLIMRLNKQMNGQNDLWKDENGFFRDMEPVK